MSDAEALMAAIAAEPENDLPRLVYADWLEENGDPDRAEFIRIQCELFRNANGLSTEEYADLSDREKVLRAEHEEEWLAPLRTLGASSNVGGWFERGFADWLMMDAADFVRNGAELWRYSPVKRLYLSNLSDHAGEVAALGHLGRPANLSFSAEKLTSSELRTVLESEHLRPLRGLSLSNAKLKLTDARSLKFAATNLRSFVIESWESSRSALVEVIRRLPPVESFSLDATERAKIDLAAVFETLDATRLTSLATEFLRADAAAMRVLATRPEFARLDRLWFRFAPVDVAAMETLATAKHLRSIRDLDFDGTGIGNGGLAALAGWPGLRTVRSLMLRDCGIGSKGIAALAASPHLTRVEKLNLDGNTIGNAGLTAIATCPAFAALRELWLQSNRIAADGAVALATASGWEGLRSLDVSGNLLGEDAVIRLVSSPHLRPARALFVSDCGVSRAGEQTLLRLLPDLQYFYAGFSSRRENEDFRAYRRRVLAEAGE